MAKDHPDYLSRREQQILDVLYKQGRASAQEVAEGMPDSPSDSAIRTHLRVLEDKGHLRHTTESQRYIYTPTKPREQAAQSAFRRLIDTFYGGSVEQAVKGLISTAEQDISPAEHAKLKALIDAARKKRRD